MNKYIIIDQKILAGKPIIKGTRIPVALVLNLLENGYTIGRILTAYPNLTKKDVLAAIDYAKKRIEREFVQVFPKNLEMIRK